MKRIMLLATLGTVSAYSAQSTTTATTTTTVNTNATVAFIYNQLITHGVAPQQALEQAQDWHPPMVIPFANPENIQEDVVDNAE